MPSNERFLAEQPAAEIVMEACATAHHWARTARRFGHCRVFDQTRLSDCNPCGITTSSGAHYWARELIKLGDDARIMDPRRVAPYRRQGRTGKNDGNDAEAICEAVGRPRMVFVPIKDPEQQAILVIHPVRKGLVNEQNRVANQLRGLLAEFGTRPPSHSPTRWLASFGSPGHAPRITARTELHSPQPVIGPTPWISMSRLAHRFAHGR